MNRERAFTLLSCAVPLGVYVFLNGHGLRDGADGQLVIAADRLGILKAPGYPLFCLLGKIATLIFPGSQAFRVHLLSSVALALSSGLIYQMARRFVSPTVALSASLLAGLSPLSFDVATRASPIAVNSVGLWVLAGWFLELHRLSRIRLFLAASLVSGSLISVHPSGLIALPALLVLSRRFSHRQSATAGIIFLIGLSAYLYLPARSQQTSYRPGGRFDTLERWTRYMNPDDGESSSKTWIPNLGSGSSRIDGMLEILWAGGFPFIILLGLGIRAGQSSEKNKLDPVYQVFGAFLLTHVFLYAGNFLEGSTSRPGESLIFLWQILVLGACLGVEAIRIARKNDPARQLGPYLLLATFIFWSYATQAEFRERIRCRPALDLIHGRSIQDMTEKGGHLVIDQPDLRIVQKYLQFVENRRPDIYLDNQEDLDAFLDGQGPNRFHRLRLGGIRSAPSWDIEHDGLTFVFNGPDAGPAPYFVRPPILHESVLKQLVPDRPRRSSNPAMLDLVIGVVLLHSAHEAWDNSDTDAFDQRLAWASDYTHGFDWIEEEFETLGSRPFPE